MRFIASFRNGEQQNVDLNLYELADFMIRDDVVALGKVHPIVEKMDIDEVKEILDRHKCPDDASFDKHLEGASDLTKAVLMDSESEPLHIDLTKEDGRTKLQKVLDSYKK